MSWEMVNKIKPQNIPLKEKKLIRNNLKRSSSSGISYDTIDRVNNPNKQFRARPPPNNKK